MNCNIELVEVLFHSQKGTWGDIALPDEAKTTTSFSKGLGRTARIKLIPNRCRRSFNFSKRFFDYHKENISSEVSKNNWQYYKCDCRKLRAPYQRTNRSTLRNIYSLFLKKNIWENDYILSNIRSGNNSRRDYFAFWGLYFDTEEDAVNL